LLSRFISVTVALELHQNFRRTKEISTAFLLNLVYLKLPDLISSPESVVIDKVLAGLLYPINKSPYPGSNAYGVLS